MRFFCTKTPQIKVWIALIHETLEAQYCSMAKQKLTAISTQQWVYYYAMLIAKHEVIFVHRNVFFFFCMFRLQVAFVHILLLLMLLVCSLQLYLLSIVCSHARLRPTTYEENWSDRYRSIFVLIYKLNKDQSQNCFVPII